MLDRIPWLAGLTFKNHYASSTRLYTCDIKYYAIYAYVYMYKIYILLFFFVFPFCVCMWVFVYICSCLLVFVFSLSPDEIRNIVKYMKNRYT